MEEILRHEKKIYIHFTNIRQKSYLTHSLFIKLNTIPSVVVQVCLCNLRIKSRTVGGDYTTAHLENTRDVPLTAV